MAYVREGMNAQVRERISSNLESPFIQFNPILYTFGLSKGENMQKLGTPNTRTVFGTGRMSEAELEVTSAAAFHEFFYQKTEPNDGTKISDVGGSTPTASGFAEDNAGTAQTGWTLFMEPIKIRVQSLEDAQSETAVDSVVDRATDPVINRYVKRVASEIWNGTLDQAGQNKRLWSSMLGITHTLTADNYYGKVDRSVETNLNPTVIDAGTHLQSTLVDLNINRLVNVGFLSKDGVTQFEGRAGKSQSGAGCTVFITTEDLWNALADQADARFQIHTSGIPGHAIAGFKNPVIEKDNVFYMYDPMCPSGTMVGLNPETWLMEIHRKHNFDFTGFVPKWETEEGGEMYEWGQFHTQLRLTCRRPWDNVRITGLTAR